MRGPPESAYARTKGRVDNRKKSKREKTQLCGTSEMVLGIPTAGLWSGQEGRRERERVLWGHDMGLEKSEEARAQRICSTALQKGKLSLVDYV